VIDLLDKAEATPRIHTDARAIETLIRTIDDECANPYCHNYELWRTVRKTIIELYREAHT